MFPMVNDDTNLVTKSSATLTNCSSESGNITRNAQTASTNSCIAAYIRK